jgi:hypothetical protein
LPQVRARAGELGLGALRQRRDALSAVIERGEAEADGVAFADARQLDLLARIASAKALAAGDDPALVQARPRVRLAAGALAWQLAQDYSARVWPMKAELAAIDAQLAEAARRDAALAQAQRDEPARFEAFAKRIAALTPLLDVMIPRVAALTKEQQFAVQAIAVAELGRQQERLAAYATQARFAVAQLYDRANAKADPKTEGDHAAARR